MIFQLTASQGGWQLRGRVLFDDILFQLTASQGGWPDYSICGTPQFHFNSQPHKEADESWLAYNRMVSHISTHSLTRRLTEHMGRYLMMCKIFQLTASQGGWRSAAVHLPPGQHFNSQPHKEADERRKLSGKFRGISTHSLTRRLTPTCNAVVACATFQLTASQGGWPVSHFHSRCKTVFQLTASQGGWHFVVPVFLIVLLHFNSQPHKEADAIEMSFLPITLFQLTASQGGWRIISYESRSF